MDLGLRHKVIVITGASEGIGLAVAKAFAGEGPSSLSVPDEKIFLKWRKKKLDQIVLSLVST